ncbi:Clan SC, family S9, unassigned serine peptidase [Tritrichomonas foetus]|uniref:Clan SC, family S9, unassigned serine peptidase n=1 Tax=Tritrichomonas foetus TaxID=1144522 RepID=A0A1J4JY18_9EUKA|nr:Clan SC, family S9, unassigned serine peptidase [Tritrichomonas foetus]|eukprot:OHT02428.1 Clan SC, family S9, unassigned serine peptidase [Tritrichomonas foetus]
MKSQINEKCSQKNWSYFRKCPITGQISSEKDLSFNCCPFSDKNKKKKKSIVVSANKNMSSRIANLSKTIIRPPKAIYKESELMEEVNDENSDAVSKREPFEIPNVNGQKIQGSIYRAINPIEGNPIVIYSHGNAGNQIEFVTFSILYSFPFHGISICGFDFSGCGNSKEPYITMGDREPSDLNRVIDHMKSLGFGRICLYGRSMGGTTSTIVMSERNDIVCGVLDSPYATLKRFIFPHINSDEGTYQEVRAYIKETVNYDIDEVNAVDKAHKITAPLLVFAGINDKTVNPKDGEEICEKSSSQKKEFISFKGNHNTFRPSDIMLKLVDFICGNLGIETFSNQI